MRRDRNHKQQSEQHAPNIAGASVVELVAVLCVLVFVMSAAAALLLVTPHTSAPEPQPHSAVVSTAGAAEPAERPFHERYPVNATTESVDPPTF
jgi:hypothetical protein